MAVALASLLLALPSAARAGFVTMHACTQSQILSSDWAQDDAPAFGGALTNVDNCGSGGRFQIAYNGAAGASSQGQFGQWQTALPPGLTLANLTIPNNAVLINPDTQNIGYGTPSGYYVRYLWNGGSAPLVGGGNCCNGMWYAAGVDIPVAGRYFIVQVACNTSTCQTNAAQPNELVDLKNVSLTAEDDAPPALSVPVVTGTGTNLGQGSRFVRGTFGLTFSASNGNASGVCGVSATINGVPQPNPVSNTPNDTYWLQCPATSSWSETVNTATYPDGPMTIALSASDAASPANVATSSSSVVVDNSPVTLALSGPSDVSTSTASGTATVTATATAGPSGANIFCAVDSGAMKEYAGESASIPVGGLGSHRVSCYAQNNAMDASGNPARSATQSFDVSIRQATAAAITFSRLADPLRCVRRTMRIPGKPRIARRHHRYVIVYGRAHKRTVVRCHARTVRRRVTVIQHRHGHALKITRIERVVELPHVVSESHLRVPHGRAASVSGFLLRGDGTALGSRSVELLQAPDDGSGQFRSFATVTTAPNGVWGAVIPAGSSRLIEAVYGGDATTEPVSSTVATLTVPAKVAISVRPHTVRWGQSVVIRGRVLGGFVPQSSKLLRLDIGVDGVKAIQGIPNIAPDGSFRTTYTFRRLQGRVRFWFTVSTLPESAFPWAPGRSQRAYVTVH